MCSHITNMTKHKNSSHHRGEKHLERNIYPEYIERNAIHRYLKVPSMTVHTFDKPDTQTQKGHHAEGTLTINPHNPSLAYVQTPSLPVDIIVDGLLARNRALHHDRVVVQIHPKSQWKRFNAHHAFRTHKDDRHTDDEDWDPPDIVEEMNDFDINDNLQPTGHVVFVDESPNRHTRPIIGYLRRNSHGAKRRHSDSAIQPGDTTAILHPVEPTAPLCVVSLKSVHEALEKRRKWRAEKDGGEAIAAGTSSYCPPDSNSLEDLGKHIFHVQIKDWAITSRYPFGEVTDDLGEAGVVDAESKGILLENGFDDDPFTEEVIACLPQQPWSIPEEELSKRKDVRDSLRVYTIDPATARDLDDALSIEDLGGGKVRVGVHIADVSFFVKPGTALDEEANRRSTSVYLVEKAIHMLPRMLSEELCSLNPDVDRLAFSVFATLDVKTGDATSPEFMRTVIRSNCRMSYEQAQAIVDGGDEYSISTSGGATLDDVRKDVKLLHKVAMARRKGRFDGGAVQLSSFKMLFSLDAQQTPIGISRFSPHSANWLVEEYMLMANSLVARHISEVFPDNALLRNHTSPGEDKVAELSRMMKVALGVDVDSTSSKAFSESINRAVAKACSLHRSDDKEVIAGSVHSLATRSMMLAKYICSQDEAESYWHHYALNLDFYTHFTSPIRRLPDIIVHRLLQAAIDVNTKGKDPFEALQGCGLDDPSDISRMADHANDRKWSAKRCSLRSDHVFLCIMLKESVARKEAIVLDVWEKGLLLLVPEFGLEWRLPVDTIRADDVTYDEARHAMYIDNARGTEVKANGDLVDAEPEKRQVELKFLSRVTVDITQRPNHVPLELLVRISSYNTNNN